MIHDSKESVFQTQVGRSTHERADCVTDTQGLHRFRIRRDFSNRREGWNGVPPLTKKLSIIDIQYQKENQFSPMESWGVCVSDTPEQVHAQE